MQDTTLYNNDSQLAFDPVKVAAIFAQAGKEGRNALNLDEIKQLLFDANFGSALTTDLVRTKPGISADIPISKSADIKLSIGIRNTREFGMIMTTGPAGAGTGLPAGRAGITVAVEMTSATDFFQLFKQTDIYQQLTAIMQGKVKRSCDDALLACFTALIAFARHFSPGSNDASYVLEELALTPCIIMKDNIAPLDVICRFTGPAAIPVARPVEKIDKLLHPETIGIIGVSAGKINFGRIILKNILGSGHDKSRLTIIHPVEEEIDGVRCVPDLQSLDHKLDLFVVAVAADAVFNLVDEIIETNAAESVMLIPGGLGETEKSREQAIQMNARINAAHTNADGGPVFLGGNCLGVISHPGNYDTWFIPAEKLPRPEKKPKRNGAMISQSGAFMITRISRNPWLDPAYLIAVGNQNDLTHADMVSYFADHDAIDVIGLYIEGFKELDGLAFAAAVRRAVINNKTVIVYKAGRSSAAQAATMGHTASIAGDFAVCKEVLTQAGAIITTEFNEFSDVFYVAGLFHDKTIGGNRLAGLSGAGFETVGIADSIITEDLSMEMATITPETFTRLEEILISKRLDALMEVRNPLDINPGADDEAHLQCVQAFADDPNVDAIVVGLDPASPMTRTLETSSRPGFDIFNESSLVQQLPKLTNAIAKPVIGIVEGGSLYDPMITQLRDQGVCIFRSTERGTKALVKYVGARLRAEQIRNNKGDN